MCSTRWRRGCFAITMSAISGAVIRIKKNTMDNTYSDEELERCTLHSPREVIFQLRGMIKRGDRVTVLFQEGRQSFLTVLLDVSEDKGLLYFDIALLIALFGFVGSAALAKFLLRGELIEP